MNMRAQSPSDVTDSPDDAKRARLDEEAPAEVPTPTQVLAQAPAQAPAQDPPAPAVLADVAAGPTPPLPPGLPPGLSLARERQPRRTRMFERTPRQTLRLRKTRTSAAAAAASSPDASLPLGATKGTVRFWGLEYATRIANVRVSGMRMVDRIDRMRATLAPDTSTEATSATRSLTRLVSQGRTILRRAAVAFHDDRPETYDSPTHAHHVDGPEDSLARAFRFLDMLRSISERADAVVAAELLTNPDTQAALRNLM